MQKRLTNICLAGMLGNLIETYDLVVFGLLSPFLTMHFLPHTAEVDAVLKFFLLFGASYLARPLGALFFGLLGDIFGRKKTLFLSMCLITVCTFLMAFLPGFDQIGPYAVYLLIALRLVQGFAYGNEFSNSVSYLYEHAPENRKNFMASIAVLGADLGVLAAYLAVLFIEFNFNSADLKGWAWRLPFLLSAFGSFIAVFIRAKSPETIEFISNSVNNRNTIKNSFKGVGEFISNWKTNLMLLPVVLLAFYTTYLLFVFMPAHIHFHGVSSHQAAFMLNIITLCIIVSLIPAIGYLADRFNIYKMLFIGTCLHLILGAPYLILATSVEFIDILPLQILIGIPCAIIFCLSSVVLISSIPSTARGLGSSLFYTIPGIVFGGFSPFMTMKLHTYYESDYSILYIFAPLCIASISCTYFLSLKNNNNNK